LNKLTEKSSGTSNEENDPSSVDVSTTDVKAVLNSKQRQALGIRGYHN